MKPEYISNIVVNRWKNNEKDKTNYTLLTMSPSGIERFDQCGKRQFEGKLEPKDIMLSEAMAASAAVLSKHMGKYEESTEGLIRLQTILGLDMGATKISDARHREQCCAFQKVTLWLTPFCYAFLLKKKKERTLMDRVRRGFFVFAMSSLRPVDLSWRSVIITRLLYISMKPVDTTYHWT